MELTQGTTFERDLAAIVAETVAWEVELDRPVGPHTRFVADLGFQSLDIVMLLLAIEGHYERQDLPFDEVLMVDGQYVPDLTVGELAAFLARHVGGVTP